MKRLANIGMKRFRESSVSRNRKKWIVSYIRKLLSILRNFINQNCFSGYGMFQDIRKASKLAENSRKFIDFSLEIKNFFFSTYKIEINIKVFFFIKHELNCRLD
jgi:hypothetical protein